MCELTAQRDISSSTPSSTGSGGSHPLRHIPALDGIRGLAILLVLVHHLLRFNPNTGNRILDALPYLVNASWVGVDLFFVLSGFLITGILYDSLGSEGYFRKFYARRMLRIFPLYYGVIFLLLALTRPLHLAWHGMQWTLLLYLQNTPWLTPLFQYMPSRYINLSQLWSLAVEEQFYLVWPFLVFWIGDRRRLLVTTLGLSAGALMLRIALLAYPLVHPVAHAVDGGFVYCFTACRADTLLLGGSLALAMRSRWRERVTSLALPVLLLALAALLAIAVYQGGFDWRKGWWIGTVGYTLLAIAGAALIAETFRKTSRMRGLCEFSGLRFLGKYSYGIYVFHPSIDGCLAVPLRTALLRSSHSKAVSVGGTFVLVVAATILIAVLSFQYFERPFLNLKKYFEYRGRRHVRDPVMD